jgi:hypothetical protein
MFGTITPSTATLQRMDDPAQNAAVINAPRSLAINRKQRRDPRPLTI